MKDVFTINFKSVNVHSGEVNHDSNYKDQTFVGVIERIF